MKVEVRVLSPGRYDDGMALLYGECRTVVGNGYATISSQHKWSLMTPPPDPVWFCSQCQRIEQRCLVGDAGEEESE